MGADKESRNSRIREVGDPLPGCTAYENRRPMRVKLKYDGLTLFAFLALRHPRLPAEKWQLALAEKRLLHRGRPADKDTIVRAGDTVTNVETHFIEPEVNPEMTWVYEDDWLFVVNKSAPLPVHSCGRFHKNCALPLLKLAFPELELRPIHRLDANTTGILVLAKSRESAARVAKQFADRDVKKSYLARVKGHPAQRYFSSDLAIDGEKSEAGSRQAKVNGLRAHTDFEVLSTMPDDSALLLATPLSGRTNQLRIHLAALGHPVLGEHIYGRDRDLSEGFISNARLHLHAWRMTLKHPSDGRLLELEADRPSWAADL